MAHIIPEHSVERRVYHWTHLVVMGLLGFTGFFIHWPFFPAAMLWMRFVHFVAMYVVVAVLLLRVSSAFLARDRDWRQFGLGFKQWKMLPGTFAYYLFLKKEKPADVGAYNPMQRLSYILIGLMIIPQAITGFALYPSTAPYFTWLTSFMGGALNVRALHFFIMWLFIAIVSFHIYLSIFEDFAQFKYMLLSIVPPGLRKQNG